MKITKQPYLMLGIFFGSITILLAFLYALNYVNAETLSILVGITQVFIGLNHLNMADKKDSKGFNIGNKKIGVSFLTLGIVIIVNAIFKMIISNTY